MLIDERIEPKNELLGKLDRIPLGRMYPAAFRALMRLQVWFTGHTHELMLDFGTRAQGVITRHAVDGQLDGTAAFTVQSELTRLWGDTWMQWTADFKQARWEAGMIAFGVGAVYHDRLLLPALNPPVAEATSPQMDGKSARQFRGNAIEEAVSDGVYDPQLRILLDAAEQLIYPSGLNLSGAIWKIDRATRDGISTVLLNGVQSGDSAWNIAKNLEQFLGAGQDCPRWASQRLYGLTASERSTSAAGLMTGENCAGQGVSYNALRLARTELQKVHNLATDMQMQAQPWVQEEQIHLSAAHPETDICDDVVSGGRDGQGIYEVGEIQLPLHPNCLCYKTAVLMPEKE